LRLILKDRQVNPMESGEAGRRSYCEVCGKRLSFKTPLGEVAWRSSHVDDDGIYCETCYLNKNFENKNGEDKGVSP